MDPIILPHLLLLSLVLVLVLVSDHPAPLLFPFLDSFGRIQLLLFLLLFLATPSEFFVAFVCVFSSPDGSSRERLGGFSETLGGHGRRPGGGEAAVVEAQDEDGLPVGDPRERLRMFVVSSFSFLFFFSSFFFLIFRLLMLLICCCCCC